MSVEISIDGAGYERGSLGELYIDFPVVCSYKFWISQTYIYFYLSKVQLFTYKHRLTLKSGRKVSTPFFNDKNLNFDKIFHVANLIDKNMSNYGKIQYNYMLKVSNNGISLHLPCQEWMVYEGYDENIYEEICTFINSIVSVR